MSKQLPILLCLLALLFAVPALAQKDKTKKSKKKEMTEAEVYDLVAQETCDCMSTKDVSKMNSSDIEMNLGLCMIGSFSAHSDVLGDDFDLGNSEGLEKMGEKIGLIMFSKCPQILMAVAASMGGEGDDPEIAAMMEEEMAWEGGEELSGTLMSMTSTGDVNFLTVRDEEGVEHELMWLRYFEGSEALLEDSKSGVGRKATIYWVPMECYSAKEKDYRFRKEIRSLTFNE